MLSRGREISAGDLKLFLVRTGRPREAREHFARAAALIERDNWFTWRYRMRLLIGLAEPALLEGATGQALALARQALDRAEPTASRRHAGRAGLRRDRALLAAGAPLQEVRAPLEQAYVLARACG